MYILKRYKCEFFGGIFKVFFRLLTHVYDEIVSFHCSIFCFQNCYCFPTSTRTHTDRHQQTEIFTVFTTCFIPRSLQEGRAVRLQLKTFKRSVNFFLLKCEVQKSLINLSYSTRTGDKSGVYVEEAHYFQFFF